MANQFDNIRIDCLRRNVLWEDPDFPASDSAIYFSRTSGHKVDWLRPIDLTRQPQFIKDGPSRFDIRQGTLGDCWVLSSLACLAEVPELLFNVIPKGQSFRSDWYSGVFVFRFWRFGEWQEVIIDDRLPVVQGRLAFLHSSDSSEFWASLLEKAYAKLHGSYEALKGGNIVDALTDFTGGLTECYRFHGQYAHIPKNIINIMFKALERQSLIGCGINPLEGQSGQVQLQNGLVAGHAYSVTDMREIRLITDQGEIPIVLIRIRNPWGSRVEWNGPFSDRSPEWNSIPKQDRENMGLVFRDDGEFWMEFRDFLDNFDTLDICNLSPDFGNEPRKWGIINIHGEWVPGVSAGGRPYYRDTHWTNPQYLISLRDCDDDEDNLCSVVVEVIQKDRRKLRHMNVQNADIGFTIYKFQKDFGLPHPKGFFDRHSYIESCDFFTNARQCTKRFLLEPGDYIVVPSTYDPNKSAAFLLRIFFEKNNSVQSAEELPELTHHVTPSLPRDLTKDTEARFKAMFYQASGEDMEIDVWEFWRLLNDALRQEPNQANVEISLDTCRSLITVTDVDRSGKLGLYEFLYLWNTVRQWKNIYYNALGNRKALPAYELRGVFSQMGYKLSAQALKSIAFRYSDQTGQIFLDPFITCVGRVLSLYNSFIQRKNDAGRISFDLSTATESLSKNHPGSPGTCSSTSQIINNDNSQG